MADVPALFYALATFCCTELYYDCLLEGEIVPPAGLFWIDPAAPAGAYEVWEVVRVYETAKARFFALLPLPNC